MSASPPLYQPCPLGVCACKHKHLKASGTDRRIPLSTRQEGRRLAARLEVLRSPEDPEHLLWRMGEQLDICLRTALAPDEVRSMCGIHIRFEE